MVPTDVSETYAELKDLSSIGNATGLAFPPGARLIRGYQEGLHEVIMEAEVAIGARDYPAFAEKIPCPLLNLAAAPVSPTEPQDHSGSPEPQARLFCKKDNGQYTTNIAIDVSDPQTYTLRIFFAENTDH